MKLLNLRTLLTALSLTTSGLTWANENGQSIVMRFHANKVVNFYVEPEANEVEIPGIFKYKGVKNEFELKCGGGYKGAALSCREFRFIDPSYKKVAPNQRGRSGDPISRLCSIDLLSKETAFGGGVYYIPTEACTEQVRMKVYFSCLEAYETQCLTQDSLNPVEAEIENNYDRLLEVTKRLEDFQRTTSAEIERLNERIRLLGESKEK